MTSHYLNQWWPSLLTQVCATQPQWVNSYPKLQWELEIDIKILWQIPTFQRTSLIWLFFWGLCKLYNVTWIKIHKFEWKDESVKIWPLLFFSLFCTLLYHGFHLRLALLVLLKIVLQYLYHILTDHNWKFENNTKGPISKCLFDTAYNTSNSHCVNELKLNLSKYSTFYNGEVVRCNKIPLNDSCCKWILWTKRNRRQNLWGRRCVSCWWPLFDSDTYTSLCTDIWFTFRSLTDGVCHLYLFVSRCLTDGERDGLWWPAHSGHWLSCTGCWQYLLGIKWLMYGLLFLYLSTSLGYFCPWISFWKMDWTCYHGPHYTQANKVEEVYWFHFVRPSVRPYVCL